MTTPESKHAPKLTSALEDYLETIFEFTQRQGFIRVKDIVRERNVKAGSVSPAMRRLADMELIKYERREYITLTEKGEKLAREIFSRHEVLSRFFCEVLQMDRAEAVENACAMEHSLTEGAKDHLVLFMEFLLNCPHVHMEHWKSFHDRQTSEESSSRCEHECDHSCIFCESEGPENPEYKRLSSLSPGEKGTVVIIEGEGEERRRLLNMGFIPGCEIAVSHLHPDGVHTEVTIDGFRLKFPSSLGSLVVLETLEVDPDATA